MPPNFTTEQEQDICVSYQKGESFQSLERRYEAFYTDIDAVLRKFNTPRREMGALNKVLVGKEPQIIADYQSGTSIRKLATKFRADRTVIKRILIEGEIPLRETGEFNRKKIYDEAEIVNLRQQGLSMEQIGKRAGISTSIVSKCLVRHGVHKKDLTRKGRPVEISEETFTKIVDLYVNSEWSLCRILKHLSLKTGHSGLSKYLKRRGVAIRSGAVQNRQFFCKSDYFSDPHHPSKYWILGFIATDGYIEERKGVLNIEIDKVDLEALQFIKKELEYTGPIHTNVNHNSVILNIRDRKLIGDIVALGIHQRKSLTLRPMEWIRDDLFPHFLNGFVSGDGWVMRKGKCCTVGFCGSSPLVPWLAKKVEKRWDVILRYRINHGCHSFQISQREPVKRICSEMFLEAPFVLKRKYDIYSQFLILNEASNPAAI